MKILVASKAVPVFTTLRSIPDIEVESSLYTDQIAKTIPAAQLVIIDFEDVVEYPYEIGVIQGLLAEALEKRRLPWTSSKEFLADPQGWMQRAIRVRGGRDLPDKLTVAFTSYSGGVGKTSLALDTVLHFAQRTERPALLLEFVYGASALAALTGVEMPYLYDLTSDPDLQPAVFKGVTLVPMDYDNCRLLASEEFGKYLKKLMAKHVLTVVDTIWPHGLLRSIQEDIDQWLIITTPRLDATENAIKLLKELGPRAAVVLNQKRGAGDSMALGSLARALDLPYVERVDQWDGKLGKQLLRYVYGSAWREYEKSQNILTALGRYLGLGRSAGEAS